MNTNVTVHGIRSSFSDWVAGGRKTEPRAEVPELALAFINE